MFTIERGNTRQINVTFTNSEAVVTDPDSNAATITIYFQDGTTYLTGTAMTRSSTGLYYYLLSTTSSNSIGVYTIEISAVFSTVNNVVNRESFYLCDIISGE